MTADVYDALMRIMDQVEAVDKRVRRLMSAAGVEDAPAEMQAPDEVAA